MWRYYRNKRLNELSREEIEKENTIVSRRFLIKQTEREAYEEYQMRKELGKKSFKTELKLLQVTFIRQKKFTRDIDIDMTNFIRNLHTKDIAVNLIQQWTKNVKQQKKKKSKKPDLQKKKNDSKKAVT